MIAPIAMFVGLSVGAAVAALFWMLKTAEGKESEILRQAGNQYRLDLARSVGYLFYSHEDSNGSLSWRRVSAD